MAKGDQRGPKGTKGPVGSSVRVRGVFSEGKELVGHSVSAVVCVIWGESRDFLSPRVRAPLPPCKCCIGYGGQRSCRMGADMGSAASAVGFLLGVCVTRHLTA